MLASTGARRFVVSLFVVCLCATATVACGGADASPAASSPSAASKSPTASPGPTKAQDLALIKKALVTADEVGKPWIKPKAVSNAGGKATEACPGRPSAITLAPPLAISSVGLTQGKQRGASIGSFTILTFSDDTGLAKYRAAWSRTISACAHFKDASSLYVVTVQEGPKAVAGADQTVSRVERLFYDAKHKKLAYARHYIGGSTGRVLTLVEYDFLTPTNDPTAKNFAPVTALLTKQLTKTKATFDL